MLVYQRVSDGKQKRRQNITPEDDWEIHFLCANQLPSGNDEEFANLKMAIDIKCEFSYEIYENSGVP